uniref:KIB1-4 beta-propeller domain-containing protein n=1 Tax=Leersia perrieri TaxID=77586 RepID=A0A0D9WCQ1_9ORYZ
MEASTSSKPELAGALPLLLHDMGPRHGGGDRMTQYTIAGESRMTHTIDELRDYRCFETQQGWVLAVADVDDDNDGGEAFLNCAVLIFDLDDYEIWACKIGGGDEWENYSYTLTMYDAADNPRPRHIARRHGVAAVAGKVYFELSGNELGVITFDDSSAMELGGVDVGMVDLTMPMGSTYLVESSGDLFLVVVFFDGDDVHTIAELAVYKMDFDMPAWCKVDGIGEDRVFLLGGDRLGHSNFGASCSASASGMRGNCVYFLNHISTHENYLHVIDMGKGTEEIGGGDEWENYSYTLTTFDAADNPRPRHIARRHGVAAVAGKVYFELSGNELGVITFDPAIDLGGVDVDMVDLPLTKPMGSTYLVESSGELFLVVVFFDGYDVHTIDELVVYKMDFAAPAAWRKVDGIGDDRVFLLGGDRLGHSNFGASCSATASGIRGNCVYFLNHISTDENYLHVIDMGKGTEEVRRPFRDMGYPLPLRPPFWLLPTD